MSDNREPEPDPRPRRALLLGGALLAAIVVWNWDWWDGGHDEPVVISFDGGDEDAEAIREGVRQQVREAVGEARSDAREAIEEAREESRAAREEAEQAGDRGAVRVERQEGGGVTISVGGDDSEG